MKRAEPASGREPGRCEGTEGGLGREGGEGDWGGRGERVTALFRKLRVVMPTAPAALTTLIIQSSSPTWATAASAGAEANHG